MGGSGIKEGGEIFASHILEVLLTGLATHQQCDLGQVNFPGSHCPHL